MERMRSLRPCQPMFGDSMRIMGGKLYYSLKPYLGAHLLRTKTAEVQILDKKWPKLGSSQQSLS